MEKETKLVLVWDMDGTLTGNWKLDMPKEEIVLNPAAISILKKAVAQRGPSGTVEAIFLLTNNSDTGFIQKVIERINEEVKAEVFSYVMDATHSRISPTSDPLLKMRTNTASKHIGEVKFMLKQIGKDPNHPYKIFFFDDLNHHLLSRERGIYFIQIQPPFTDTTEPVEDRTLWSVIENELKPKKKQDRELLVGQKKGKKVKTKQTRKRKTKS